MFNLISISNTSSVFFRFTVSHDVALALCAGFRGVSRSRGDGRSTSRASGARRCRGLYAKIRPQRSLGRHEGRQKRILHFLWNKVSKFSFKILYYVSENCLDSRYSQNHKNLQVFYVGKKTTIIKNVIFF